MIRIEKSQANPEKGVFNFTANINNILKMNLQLMSKTDNK